MPGCSITIELRMGVTPGVINYYSADKVFHVSVTSEPSSVLVCRIVTFAVVNINGHLVLKV